MEAKKKEQEKIRSIPEKENKLTILMKQSFHWLLELFMEEHN